jgi:hypothetical protein
MKAFDYIASARSIRDALIGEDLETCRERIDDAIASGSTGTEILMALRWILSELQQANPGLSPALKAQTAAFIDAANEVLS